MDLCILTLGGSVKGDYWTVVEQRVHLQSTSPMSSISSHAFVAAVMVFAIGCDDTADQPRIRTRRAPEAMSSQSWVQPKPDWKTYTSPAEFYSVDHPVRWHVSREENIVNIAPPDPTGAITISAYYGEAPIADFTQTWLRDSFEAKTPTTKLQRVSRNGWQGYRQEFVEDIEAGQRAWIAIVAESGPVFVLITANELVPVTQKRRDTYERMMESVKLHPPERRESDI